MKTGTVIGQPSRRELRRERTKEAERRSLRHGDSPEPQDEIAPTKLPPGRTREAPEVTPSRECVSETVVKSDLPLPSQEELRSRFLRPMSRVELIWQPRPYEDEQEIRVSSIQDLDGRGNLYLSQTSPPILRSQVGSLVEVTFLSRYRGAKGGQWLRVGYHTEVKDVIPDHRLGPMLREPVVVIPGPEELAPATVRTSFRVSPPQDLDFRLMSWPDKAELGLVDISVSGAQFSHSLGWDYTPGYKLKLCVASGKLKIPVDSSVVRSGTTMGRKGWIRKVTSVRFVDLDKRDRRRLFKLLYATYRHCLAQRSGVFHPEEGSPQTQGSPDSKA